MMRIVAACCLLLVLIVPGEGAQPRRGKAKTPPHGAANPIDKQVDFAALAKKLGQVKLVNKLVDAAHYLEDIFLRQSDPEVIGLMESLKSSSNPKDKELLRMLR